MSRHYYESLLSGRPSGGADLGMFGDFAEAARVRRAALAMANDELEEGVWVEDEAPPMVLRGTPMMRMAADDGASARAITERPIEVDGADGWAVTVGSEPTIDGGSLFTLERLWQGPPPTPAAPGIAVVIAGEETDLVIHLALRPHEAARQAAVPMSPSGRLQAMAWAVTVDD